MTAPAAAKRALLVQKIMLLTAELQATSAELQALDAGEAPSAGEELIDVGTAAKLIGLTKGAIRMAIARRGCGVRVGGRTKILRSDLAALYPDRAFVRPDRAFVRSHEDQKSAMKDT